MLQAMGRGDYHKFRFPYWDWRGEIQRSYGLPSEELFSFNRFGETRNISEHPVVFGDIVADNWATICLNTFTVLCDPNMKTGPLQRCPFTGNPILCHSSNPGWPTMQQVNDILEVKYYETPPFNASGSNSFRPDADFYVTPIGAEECREDDYCVCLPIGFDCEDPSAIRLILGIHSMVRKL